VKIPFNKPFLTGREIKNIHMAYLRGELAGDGYFTRKCQQWLEKKLGTKKAFLTHSCTAALEMAAILADIQPGDEIIMPSYTFVSTANAFVLRGGVPVFVDIRRDTLNIDEKLIEKAITRKTKAIVPVHYAGVGCEMDAILKIARRHRLLVIEDAAHCVNATYKGRELGSIGHLGALSFHETKNIICGEGGALLINDKRFVERAEIIWQKGTNRKAFQQRRVDKYTWVDLGSSFLPGEITAAFLLAQMQHAWRITQKRLDSWHRYHELLAPLEKAGKLRRPIVANGCQHNAHIYYILLNSLEQREQTLKKLEKNGVNAVFHYVPLHTSPMGKKYGRSSGQAPITQNISERILRLPLFIGLNAGQQSLIAQILDCQGKLGSKVRAEKNNQPHRKN
jgi:dTDP-4-amino-4,6-dideoxygalactose transaminase